MDDKLLEFIKQANIHYLPADIFFTYPKKKDNSTARNESKKEFSEARIEKYNYSGTQLNAPYKPTSRLIASKEHIIFHKK